LFEMHFERAPTSKSVGLRDHSLDVGELASGCVARNSRRRCFAVFLSQRRLGRTGSASGIRPSFSCARRPRSRAERRRCGFDYAGGLNLFADGASPVRQGKATSVAFAASTAAGAHISGRPSCGARSQRALCVPARA
jgi:hypothetical protein